MSAALLAARLVLAAIFVIAGVAKLADLPGSRRATREFGVPERLAGVVGLGVPIAELVIAASLVPAVSARGAALGATVLLTAFAAAIGRSMARGQRPDCHCFGQLHSAPAGPESLVRNIVLAGVAGSVAVGGGRHAGGSATHWVTSLTTAQAAGLVVALLLGAAVVFLGWLSLQLLAQNGRLLARMEGLEARLGTAPATQPDGPAADGIPVGASAPAFVLPDAGGEVGGLVTLLSAERSVMLVFSDPGCGSCTMLLPEIARWQGEHRSELLIALISQGDAAAGQARAQEHGLENVFLDEQREVSKLYGVRATPSAVIVDREGRIASALVGGADAIRGLQSEALAGDHEPRRVAPEFALSDLDGRIWSLADLRGRQTLLLFWNPRCGFCRQMVEDLRALEVERRDRDPRLVVVSAASVPELRAENLSSTVLLDPGFTMGASLGATGTPNAVLLDADANVASGVVTGAADVLALARRAGQPTGELVS